MLLESFGYRALDLTGVTGAFCGKVLAEQGIEIIKVEPPEGSPERRLGPFFHDEPHPEKSLYWLAYNTGKRGITLNLHTADGRDLLQRLVTKVDFLIESFPPGFLDGLGVGYKALSQLNPRLVYTSITPFGQSGPYADYVADDLTILALSGSMFLQGDADRAPLRYAVEQSFPQAGAQAAAATMVAHYYRETSDRGQHVDVSMQEAMARLTNHQYQYWHYQQKIGAREGTRLRGDATAPETLFRCQDGYVAWILFVAAQGGKTRALVEWMAEEGVAGSLVEVNWEDLDMSLLTQPEIDRWEAVFGRFFLTHTKAELHRGAIERGIMLFPMYHAVDLLHDAHLAARHFWIEVEHPYLGATIRYPNLPYHCPTDSPFKPFASPTLGQHNADVYCDELGLSPSQLTVMRENGVI